MRAPLVAFLLLTAPLVGCATYTDELNRGQAHYQANDYERALAVFRMLETDGDSFGPPDRARYAYLHGMTAYRISQRPEARHWLALARYAENKHPGALDPSWKARLDEAAAAPPARVKLLVAFPATPDDARRRRGDKRGRRAKRPAFEVFRV
jgi:hypothetical protein